jgi:hypothetical protein
VANGKTKKERGLYWWEIRTAVVLVVDGELVLLELLVEAELLLVPVLVVDCVPVELVVEAGVPLALVVLVVEPVVLPVVLLTDLLVEEVVLTVVVVVTVTVEVDVDVAVALVVVVDEQIGGQVVGVQAQVDGSAALYSFRSNSLLPSLRFGKASAALNSRMLPSSSFFNSIPAARVGTATARLLKVSSKGAEDQGLRTRTGVKERKDLLVHAQSRQPYFNHPEAIPT